MKILWVIAAVFGFVSVTGNATAGEINCTSVDDEFRALMNRDFLKSPEKYVSTVTRQFTMIDYERRQKGLFFTIDQQVTKAGVAIIKSESGRHAKIRYSWMPGYELVQIHELWIYPDAETGKDAQYFDRRPGSGKPIELWTDCGLDIDAGGEVICGEGKDIVHRAGREFLYLEAANGSVVHFPVESLCYGRKRRPNPGEPIPIPTFTPRPGRSHSIEAETFLLADGGRIDCRLAYDEVSSFMNREFVTSPARYTSVKDGAILASEWRTLNGTFHLLQPFEAGGVRKGWDPGWAVAVGRTGRRAHMRLRYAFVEPKDGADTVIGLSIRDRLLYRNPVTTLGEGAECALDASLKAGESWAADLDTCQIVDLNDPESDIRLTAVDGDYRLEAVNSASLRFPTESLCNR